MSAWMCSDVHISILVDAIHLFGINEEGKTKEDTFAVCHLENQLSLASRYGDEVSETHTGYTQATPEVRPEDVYFLTRSYMCQSCEHTEWEHSKAHELAERLELKHLEIWGVDLDQAYDRATSVNPHALWSVD